MQLADTGGLSWREPREDRDRGAYKVRITSLGPKAVPEAVATLISRQKEIELADAVAEVDLLIQGQPLECRFWELGKARLFSIVCRTKGAISEVVE